MSPEEREVQAIRERYERRRSLPETALYDPASTWVLLTRQERERAMVEWIDRAGMRPLNDKRVLEVGCGAGKNLLQLLSLGFAPHNLVGVDLLEESLSAARALLPSATQLLSGDASAAEFAPASFDVVYQSVVFTSILDAEFQQRLATRMWNWTKPGGGVLWYDFVVNNPWNPDVRGVPIRRVRELFPEGRIWTRRLTLAPPIGRRVARVHRALYALVGAIAGPLKTHALCWIEKP